MESRSRKLRSYPLLPSLSYTATVSCATTEMRRWTSGRQTATPTLFLAPADDRWLPVLPHRFRRDLFGAKY